MKVVYSKIIRLAIFLFTQFATHLTDTYFKLLGGHDWRPKFGI